MMVHLFGGCAGDGGIFDSLILLLFYDSGSESAYSENVAWRKPLWNIQAWALIQRHKHTANNAMNPRLKAMNVYSSQQEDFWICRPLILKLDLKGTFLLVWEYSVNSFLMHQKKPQLSRQWASPHRMQNHSLDVWCMYQKFGGRKINHSSVYLIKNTAKSIYFLHYFNYLNEQFIYIYVYVYIYVCVCVCIYCICMYIS